MAFVFKSPLRIFTCAALLVAPMVALFSIQSAMAAETKPTLVLTGEAQVSAEPDMALISIGTVTENADAKAALSSNNARITAILNALETAGIAKTDLQTSNFSVQPNIVYPKVKSQGNNSGPKIVGYTVRNTINVRLRDLTKIGDVLGQAVSLGANSVSGPQFAVIDPSTLQADARKNAMREAISKAQDYADAAGIRLASIVSIREDGGMRTPDVPMTMMARESSGESVPIAAGEISYNASVTVTWQIAE